jgi:hypothetical protein
LQKQKSAQRSLYTPRVLPTSPPYECVRGAAYHGAGALTGADKAFKLPEGFVRGDMETVYSNVPALNEKHQHQLKHAERQVTLLYETNLNNVIKAGESGGEEVEMATLGL